jgi:hypothetical protein
MKKNKLYSSDIEILKERQKLRILQQEMKIKSGFKELGDNLTGTSIKNRLKDNMFSGSGLAFKLGYMAVSIITEQIRRRKKKK